MVSLLVLAAWRRLGRWGRRRAMGVMFGRRSILSARIALLTAGLGARAGVALAGFVLGRRGRRIILTALATLTG